MTRPAVLLALVLAGAAPCAAQQMINNGPKQLTPEQAQAQKGIILLRDSVVAAQGALRQLQRDYAKASPITLEAWARQVADRCAAAARTAPVARQLVAGGSFVPAAMAKGQKTMVEAIDQVAPALGDCTSTFKPLAEAGKGEEVRAYGNARAKPLLKRLDKFDQAVHQSVQAMQLDIREVTRAGRAPI